MLAPLSDRPDQSIAPINRPNRSPFLLVPADAQELAKFMAHVNRNISIEAGHENKWKDPLWERCYRAIVVWDEETQIDRLRYLLVRKI